ncbi:MAG TPA: hypothetical protein ENK70_09075 [Methylophaga sp.]|nr:hypothetical protein [Methylophaga sp.]
MAEVRLAQVYEPTAFNAAVQEAATELNGFLSSGVLARDARIDEMVGVGGMVGELPNFNPLTNDEPDYVTDNPANLATPANIASGTQIYRLANQHKSWSTMDLARQLALADPLGAIANRIGHYWAVNSQQRVVSSSMGVLADNIANDAGDMVVDVSIAAGNSAVAANLINADAVIDAKATLGDNADSVTAIAMHSVCYTTLQKLQLIDFIPDARGEVSIPTYLGLRVIVDDQLDVTAGGTNGFVYTSVLFGQGAFGYGTTPADQPSELERVANAGYGGGQDIIHSRFNEIIHPQGFAFLSSGISAGVSATRTNLETAAQWNRIYTDRKNVPLAFLQTNG